MREKMLEILGRFVGQIEGTPEDAYVQLEALRLLLIGELGDLSDGDEKFRWLDD